MGIFIIVQLPNSVLHILDARDETSAGHAPHDAKTAMNYTRKFAKLVHLLHGFCNSIAYSGTQGWLVVGLATCCRKLGSALLIVRSLSRKSYNLEAREGEIAMLEGPGVVERTDSARTNASAASA